MGAGRRKRSNHIPLRNREAHRLPYMGRARAQYRTSGVFRETQHGSTTVLQPHLVFGESFHHRIPHEARRSEKNYPLLSDWILHLQYRPHDCRLLRRSDAMPFHTHVLGSSKDRPDHRRQSRKPKLHLLQHRSLYNVHRQHRHPYRRTYPHHPHRHGMATTPQLA